MVEVKLTLSVERLEVIIEGLQVLSDVPGDEKKKADANYMAKQLEAVKDVATASAKQKDSSNDFQPSFF